MAGAPGAASPDVLIADFEGASYGAWQATGTAFGSGPARGTLPGQMPVSGYLGGGLVNSFRGGDGATGTLTSPEFRIERRYLTFLIGGGGFAGETCMDLLVEGKVVRTAAGPNRAPGGSERLEPAAWDVGDLAGKSARIRIVDAATGGWGHVNVDQIMLTDQKPPLPLKDVERRLTLTGRYLHFPVKTGAKKRRVSLIVDGHTTREFEIELADGRPDFWTFLDTADYRGKEAVVRVDELPEGSGALAAIIQSDRVDGDEQRYPELYREAHRPQLHFTSRRGWLNDPNGLVYAGGEWHLYYQHNPYGWDWGNMHWGHAVSKDLVHWQELPIAVYPHALGDWAFSGSAAVDRENSSGWKTGNDDLLVAAYTSTGRGECLLYSNDRGRTWTEYEGNPVVRHQGRDPRLVWHEPTRRWVMAVYDEHDGKQWIAFYTSPDLKHWEFGSRIEGFFECPELFPMAVEGTAERKWVLWAADGKYMTGAFDGREFHPDGPKRQLWWGNFYASQTYSGAPDGRRVQIGWGQGITFPGMPFNQQMAFPVELRLRAAEDGPRLYAEPVREVEKLRGKRHTWKDLELAPGSNPLRELSGDLWEVRADLETGGAAGFAFRFHGVPVSYDAAKGELTVNHVTAPLQPENGRLRLRLLVDRGSIEAYGNGGRIAVSAAAIPADGAQRVELIGIAGSVRVRSLEVWELRSAWR